LYDWLPLIIAGQQQNLKEVYEPPKRKTKGRIGQFYPGIGLTEQVRSLPTSRMMRYVGQLSKPELRPISRALANLES
jgi:hypothetical protein